MKISLLDFDKVININKLEEITSPKIYDTNKQYHPDGIMSNEIFGMSKSDRRGQFAWIDLKGPFIHPHVYGKVILQSFKKIFLNIITGTQTYSIKDHYFVEDENGWTGLNELYNHWDEIDWNKSGTQSDRNLVLMTKAKKDQIFVKKFLICPPAYRDIMISDQKGKADKIGELNSAYTKIINCIKILESGGLFARTQYATQAKIQQYLIDIYDLFKKQLEKKSGLIKFACMGKNTSYGSRVVITAPSYSFDRYEDAMLDTKRVLVPISICCSTFYPFIKTWISNFFKKQISENTDRVINGKVYKIKTPDIQFSEKNIKRIIDNYMKNPNERFELLKLVLVDKENNEYVDNILLKGKTFVANSRENSNNNILQRPMTITDLIYLACVDSCEKRHIFLSRYPIGTDKSLIFQKITVMSTIKHIKLIYNGKEYPYYPDIDLKIPHDQVGINFVDTVAFPNTQCKGLGADYDGDQVSIRGIWSDEANMDIERNLNSKISALDIELKPSWTLEDELVTATYAMTQDKPDAKNVTPEDQKRYLEMPIYDITLTFLVNTFCKRASEKNRISDHRVRYRPYDLMTVPKDHFYQGQPEIKTTIGRYFYNKFILVPSKVIELVKYQNEPLTGKKSEALTRGIGDLYLNDKVTRDQYNEYINRRDVLLHWLAGLISSTITEAFIKPNKQIEKRRDEMVKENQEGISKNDINVINKVEKEMCKYAREVLKDDSGMELYDSGQLSFDNNYKNNFIFKGAARNTLENKIDFIPRSFSNGLEVKNLPIIANGLVFSEYQKGVKTRTSGYMGKKILALLQMMQVDEPGTDCGTKNVIPFLITPRNKNCTLYVYIREEGKLVLLTPENIDNYVGKYVMMRSPMACISPNKICNKCAGEIFYKLNITNIGYFASTINFRFLNYSMKLKHDISVKLSHINPDSFIEPV